MSTAGIGLGSNIGDRLYNLQCAQRALRELVSISATSSVFETKPVGFAEQPDFLNAVILVETTLAPEDLLQACLDIERELGRVRTEKNGPRTIDLDILFYDNFISDDPSLTLPHPRMHERAFVLVPLLEIAPQYLHPRLSRSIEDLLAFTGSDAVVQRTAYVL